MPEKKRERGAEIDPVKATLIWWELGLTPRECRAAYEVATLLCDLTWTLNPKDRRPDSRALAMPLGMMDSLYSLPRGTLDRAYRCWTRIAPLFRVMDCNVGPAPWILPSRMDWIRPVGGWPEWVQ
jgi:hypothetical protein